MKKILFINLLLSCLSLQVYSKPEKELKHIVKKGETLSSISRAYGLKVKDLLKVNPELSSSANIKPGQQLHIPGSGSNYRHQQPAEKYSAGKPKSIMVPSTPDTPYKDEDDRTRKQLSQTGSPAMAVTNEQPAIDKPKEVNDTAFSLRTTSPNASEYADIYNQYAAHGYGEKKNNGEASYLEENTSGNQYLALYNQAETGSLIKVTSLMNQKTVYVKVVGKVPQADAGNEVIIKLSNKVAMELGAIDSKFLVEVSSPLASPGITAAK